MQTFTITEEIRVRASLDTRVNHRSSGARRTGDGKPLMMLETHPGGRWYRDLGGDNGHLWGFVQSIKRPVLRRFRPLFMSTGATSNLRPIDRDRRRIADHVQAHGDRPVLKSIVSAG